MNPIASMEDVNGERHEPTLQPVSNHAADSDELFHQTLDQLQSIWPEYHCLKELNSRPLSSSAMSTLQQVCKRVIEQHHMMQVMAEEKRAVEKKCSNLIGNYEDKDFQLKQKEIIIQGLRQDLSQLQEQLEAKDVVDDLDSNVYDDVHPSPPGRPSNMNPRGRKKHSSIYSPTPLIIAEKERNEVKRSQSLNPVGSGPGGRPVGRSDSFTGANGKRDNLAGLKAALEQERQENIRLRQRQVLTYT